MKNESINPIPIAAHAPPLPTPRISRRVWIGGAIGAVLVISLIGIGVGVGISFALNKGGGSGIVGKWESLSAAKPQGTVTEFRSNGTGVDSAPVAGLQLAVMKQARQDSPEWLAKMGIKDGVLSTEFKWSISQERKPVLLIEIEEKKVGDAFRVFAQRDYFYFKREGDTLTLTDLQMPFPQTYRKAQP